MIYVRSRGYLTCSSQDTDSATDNGAEYTITSWLPDNFITVFQSFEAMQTATPISSIRKLDSLNNTAFANNLVHE